MSRPIKPVYEIGKLTGILSVLVQELHIARRVGLDTYDHFWVVVNWRKFAGMVQALVGFELILAAAFTGRGLSVFGTTIEHRFFQFTDPILTSVAFLSVTIGGIGLYCNKRWAFLLNGVILVLMVMLGGLTGLVVQLVDGTPMTLLVFVLAIVIQTFAAIKVLARYQHFDRSKKAELVDNP